MAIQTYPLRAEKTGMGFILNRLPALIRILVLLALVPGPEALAGLFSPLIFEDIQIVAQEILERFPPEQYHYVGIGRSPTPVVAYLEVLAGEGAVSNLPYSAGVLSQDSNRNTLTEQSWLKDHFDRFLPHAMGNRQLLLVDFVVSGSGLASITHFLQEYATERGLDPPIPLLLTHQLWNEEKVHHYFEVQRVEQLSIYRRSHLYLALRDAIFDEYSEYPGLMDYRKKNLTPMPSESRQGYQKMKSWIRHEIKAKSYPQAAGITRWVQRLLSCTKSLTP